MTLLYNALMLAVDLAAIWVLGRHRGLPTWCGMGACAGGAAVGLAGLLGGLLEDHFGFIRLLAYGVFLHGTALLAVMAFLWRRTRPWLAVGAALAVVASLLIAADAFLVEPHWLEVSHWRFTSPKIHRSVRIVVVADLQTDRITEYERDALKRAMAEKPDVILLAGDYLQVCQCQEPRLRKDLRALFEEVALKAPLGVFAIGGNVDRPGWPSVFDGLGITSIETNRSFDLGDLQLTCVGWWVSRATDLRVTGAPPDRFHVVMGHVPNFALGRIDADLLLAGHTHGGQVRIPGLGPIITHAKVPNAWAAGLTELPGGAKLLVSRGIGMERGNAPPMRFLCRPELLVIDLLADEPATHEQQEQ